MMLSMMWIKESFVTYDYALITISSDQSYCQARGPDHVQVNSRRLQGLKKLLVILKSQGLDQEIDSIIGRYHPPTHHKTFLDPITLLSLHEVDDKLSG